jgi:DNA adenine methylase
MNKAKIFINRSNCIYVSEIKKRQKMKPLIKWAGGKSNEIKYIRNSIPKFDRYLEPFLGGGALFFDLEPSKAIINDISGELTTFYNLLKNGKSGEIFKEKLYDYVNAWERINVYISEFGESFVELYNEYRSDIIDIGKFSLEIDKLFLNKIIPFNGLFMIEFCINQEDLLREIKKNLISKLKRTKEKIDIDKKFSSPEVKKNIESAFRSGFYTHFRTMMNLAKKGELEISKEKKIANWYFIREFCYGGMFRFNKSGDFNVPYGGIGYNKKDFRAKVDYLFSSEVRELLTNTTVENKDFEELLNSIDLNEKDFIFLDPPYDSEFSEYEENAFTKKDQERLAKTLINLKAKWILIIKETPFILDLYDGKEGVKIAKFDKNYLFQIRSRIDTKVKHLIIHNLDKPIEEQKKLLE